MKSIGLKDTYIHYGENAYLQINRYLKQKKPAKVFVLVDSETHRCCLTQFLQEIETTATIEILEMPAGEENKNLSTVEHLWATLSDFGADRQSLFINLGGGVVTDLGGFVASTYQRGIDFIHAPTSLLGMVDAAIGGKNGIDLGNLKNQIGVVKLPEMVMVDPSFLATLSPREMKSGLAEMLKHGIIDGEKYWSYFEDLSQFDISILGKLIWESIDIKTKIVTQDPFEKNVRKTLNFGHTLGHAIESFRLNHPKKEKLLHGEAIAIGMILACFLSHELVDFPKKKLQRVTQTILQYFSKESFSKDEIEQIIELMKHDKKNTNGKVNFVLVKDFGECEINCKVENKLIFEAFDFYQNC
ncbi:MAG: 3-dehydroquinate synthase [Bacteroidota bacterium]